MRKIFLSLMAVAALMTIASCSKSDDIDGKVTGDNVEIKLSGKALSITPESRAAFEGITSTNSLEAKIIASSNDEVYNGGDMVKDGKMIFTDNGTTAKGFLNASGVADPAYYPHATNSVYLVGLYPYSGWTVAGDGKTATYTFNGSQDIMAAPAATTTRSQAVAGTYPTLTFDHLLTRLNITLQAQDAAAVAAWGKVTSLKLKDSKNADNITVTLKQGTAPVASAFTASGATADFDCRKVTGDVAIDGTTNALELPLTTPATPQAYVLAAPKNVTAGTTAYTLEVTTENHTTAYPVNIVLKNTLSTDFSGDTQKLYFDVTLTFTATQIKAKATVNAWSPGGSGSGSVQ